MSAIEKERGLIEWMSRHRRVAIGFSGGVDSAYLAVIAMEALGAADALAIIGKSESLAGREEAHAAGVARQVGIPVLEVDTGELSDERYAANPRNRCYFCKSVLWTTLLPIARAHGFGTLVDGTNADDLHDYRPGGRAATEQGILSPLAELQLTKDEIRERTRARGWDWWDRPSSPCLASRLPYGMAVTQERLRQVEIAEAALRDLGISGNLRVRHHGDVGRVEIDRAQLPAWNGGAALESVVRAVRTAGFANVELDPRGFRSGALNVIETGTGASLPGH